MWRVNSSIFVIFLACSLEVSALRCYKCNQTEIFTRKCVIDSADEVECAEGEVCSYGRTVKGESLQDLIGCERKESCDADSATGCKTCDTNLCNIFARNVVAFENRIEITKLPSGETIIKEEHSAPTINQPVAVPLPVTQPINNQFPFQFPFFQLPNFGFNNYGFTGGFNRPQQGGFPHENFFKPPFFVSQSSQVHPPTQSMTQNYPPYAPFFSFAPFGMPQARPPYVHEPQVFPRPQPETIPVAQNELPQRPLVIITPPREENEIFVKPIEPEVPEKVETTTEQPTTLKPPSLATSILQQFSSNPSDPNRTPSISDLVLNLGASTTKPTEKPVETTTKQPLDVPVTIPEIIEKTENPEITELPTNKDFIALQTDATTTAKSLETTTLDSKTEISSTTSSPIIARAAEEDEDDDNDVNPSKNEPENLRFDIRREDEKLEEVKFPETFYFETQSGDISFESAPQESAEMPVFSKLR